MKIFLFFFLFCLQVSRFSPGLISGNLLQDASLNLATQKIIQLTIGLKNAVKLRSPKNRMEEAAKESGGELQIHLKSHRNRRGQLMKTVTISFAGVFLATGKTCHIQSKAKLKAYRQAIMNVFLSHANVVPSINPKLGTSFALSFDKKDGVILKTKKESSTTKSFTVKDPEIIEQRNQKRKEKAKHKFNSHLVMSSIAIFANAKATTNSRILKQTGIANKRKLTFVEEASPQNNHLVHIHLGKIYIATGSGRNIFRAKQAAAKLAVKRLQEHCRCIKVIDEWKFKEELALTDFTVEGSENETDWGSLTGYLETYAMSTDTLGIHFPQDFTLPELNKMNGICKLMNLDLKKLPQNKGYSVSIKWVPSELALHLRSKNSTDGRHKVTVPGTQEHRDISSFCISEKEEKAEDFTVAEKEEEDEEEGFPERVDYTKNSRKSECQMQMVQDREKQTDLPYQDKSSNKPAVAEEKIDIGSKPDTPQGKPENVPTQKSENAPSSN